MIDIPDFLLNCHGDTELIQVLLQHGLRQPHLGAIHRCPIFLKVLHLRQDSYQELAALLPDGIRIQVTQSGQAQCSGLAYLEHGNYKHLPGQP